MEHIHGPKPRPEHRAWTQGDGDIGGLVGFLASAQPGQRNASPFWTACQAHEKGLPTDELLTTAVQIGLSEYEAKATIKSASETVRPR
jgi:hypothetical protein